MSNLEKDVNFAAPIEAALKNLLLLNPESLKSFVTISKLK